MNLRKLLTLKGAIVLAFILALIGGGASLAATYKSGVQPQAAATTQVVIKNFAYSPATVNVAIGTTVVWVNQDSVGHTVTANNGSWESQLLNQGDTYSYTFTKEGVYYYYCGPHPWMVGRVIVGNPANVPSQDSTSTSTSDWYQWMIQRMNQVHGQGAFDAMQQYMDQTYGAGSFDSMLQYMEQNGYYCGWGAAQGTGNQGSTFQGTSPQGNGTNGFGYGRFGGGMMGSGFGGPGMMGYGFGR